MGKLKTTLLIVDDNKFFIERVISLIEESCQVAKIEIAYDYEEAITSLENNTPDIVLLDINMPGKNGIELLQEVRRREKECLIIMISNHDNEYYREQCKKLGADHFLDKSDEFGMLPSIINSIGK